MESAIGKVTALDALVVVRPEVDFVWRCGQGLDTLAV